MPDPDSRLALVLHAHLPAVPSGDPDAPESSWFFRVLAESYVPVLKRLGQLAREGVAFRVAMHWSPLVRAALGDARVRRGFVAWLEKRIASGEPESRARWIEVLKTFTHDWKEEVPARWEALAASGHVEIMAGSATHALLPLLGHQPDFLHAQIALGRAEAADAGGFWLPEAACSPEIADTLAGQGVRWTVSDDNAAGPSVTPGGLAVFPVARRLAAMLGEPPVESANAFLSALGGFAVVPVEIEALGHCWPGGIDFLEAVLRNAETGTPGDFLASSPALPTRAVPAFPSVEGKAFAETWLNERTRWLYPEMAEIARLWLESAREASPDLPRVSGALAQAAREFLLCQSSDWPLMVTADPSGLGVVADARLREHLHAARALSEQARAGSVSEGLLAARETRRVLFPNLDWRALRDAV